jgi:hypothetical protein
MNVTTRIMFHEHDGDSRLNRLRREMVVPNNSKADKRWPCN